MYTATCPKCFNSIAFELPDGRTRVSCPNCLRTFDPFEPLAPAASEVASDKAGGLDALMNDDDDDEAPDFAPQSEEAGDDEPERDEDFDQGL